MWMERPLTTDLPAAIHALYQRDPPLLSIHAGTGLPLATRTHTHTQRETGTHTHPYITLYTREREKRASNQSHPTTIIHNTTPASAQSTHPPTAHSVGLGCCRRRSRCQWWGWGWCRLPRGPSTRHVVVDGHGGRIQRCGVVLVGPLQRPCGAVVLLLCLEARPLAVVDDARQREGHHPCQYEYAADDQDDHSRRPEARQLLFDGLPGGVLLYLQSGVVRAVGGLDAGNVLWVLHQIWGVLDDAEIALGAWVSEGFGEQFQLRRLGQQRLGHHKPLGVFGAWRCGERSCVFVEVLGVADEGVEVELVAALHVDLHTTILGGETLCLEHCEEWVSCRRADTREGQRYNHQAVIVIHV
mmetsp:Transcript_37476/g.107253  ORF Transcript_37476/g.107253 Transcript_37476/m.107253 type:complete len:356 (+) Transcript_37476:1696-2763(+)